MDEQTLRRREFLARTASAAGLAGLSGVAGRHRDRRGREAPGPAAARAAQHADRPRRRRDDGEPVVRPLLRLARGRGRRPDAVVRGRRRRASGCATRHASSLEAEWQGCGHPDPGHGWESGRAQLRDGFLAEGSGNDEFALTYYDEGEVEFIHAAAKQFTVYDRFFCSVLSSTWPNRYYKWSAQSGGRKDNAPPLDTAGNQWETIFDRALARGVTAQLLQLRPAVLGGLGSARRVVDAAAGASTTRTARSGRCRTSRSSTRRSATAAAATASRPTSTRTATCGSGRRGWPTSCARS